MPQNPSWRHHFIPKFYLANWAIHTDRQLCEFSRPYGSKVKAQRRAPNATGFEKHLYTLELGPGQAADVFETGFLASVDDKAASLFQRIQAGGRLNTPQEMSDFSRFIIALFQRDPVTVNAIKQRIGQDYERLVAYGRRRCATDPEAAAAFEMFLAQARGRIVAGAVFQTLTGAMDSLQVGTLLNNMIWRVADLSQGKVRLMTSDRPTIISDRGLNGENGFIALTLSPNKAAFGFHAQAHAASLDRWPPDDLARWLNEQVVRQAVKYVYATDDIALRFVERLMSARGLPSLQQNLGARIIELGEREDRTPIEDDARYQRILSGFFEPSGGAPN